MRLRISFASYQFRSLHCRSLGNWFPLSTSDMEVSHGMWRRAVPCVPFRPVGEVLPKNTLGSLFWFGNVILQGECLTTAIRGLGWDFPSCCIFPAPGVGNVQRPRPKHLISRVGWVCQFLQLKRGVTEHKCIMEFVRCTWNGGSERARVNCLYI